MNYYEQFYDDLEFAEEDAVDVGDEFDARNYRQKPYSRNEDRWNRGRGPNRGGPNRGGRGQNRGRGNNNNGNRGRGNRGKPDPGIRGKLKGKNSYMTNFVKAGELTPVTDQPVVTYPTANQSGQQENTGQASQQAGGIGYGVFMPKSSQQEENNFSYSNPLYGYGEGSDFSSYGYPNQAGGQDQGQGQQMQSHGYQQPGQDGSMYPTGYDPSYQYNSGAGYPGYENQQWGYEGYNYWPQQQPGADGSQLPQVDEGPPGVAPEAPVEIQEPKPKVNRKPMVIPSMNFVKASSEFKSTDLEAKKGGQTQIIEAVPKSGDKRAGLGFGKVEVPIQSGAGEAFDIATQDLKFAKLAESVKSKYAPNKNAIEILHMSIQKVKGIVLDFDISPIVSTTDNFQCIVTVNGIHVGKAGDSKKKGAKLKACTEAVNLLISGKPLTVRKSASGHYELKPKVVDVIHPATVSETAPSKKSYAPSQGGVVTTSKTPASTAKSAPSTTTKSTPTTAAAAAYSKPKIVFHAAGNPPSAPSSKPLPGFVKAGQAADENGTMKDDSNTKPMAQIAAGKKRKAGGNVNQRNVHDLSKFILLKTAYIEVNNVGFLHTSADFNRASVSYDFEPDPEGFECSVIIGGNAVSSGTGFSKEKAKSVAVDEAVEFLQDICYTIVVKIATGYDENADTVSKGELEGGVTDTALPSSNIGNALLKKMGWVGGGIGKDGTGIAEPIKANNVIGRKGLGLVSGNQQKFCEKVEKILKDFAHSNSDNEIHFSAELTKEERAQIHQMAQKMHLKSVSRGKGENRYLTISRKRSLQQLLNHVIESGGVTDKYEILPPKNPNITYDVCKRDAGGYSHMKQ